MAGAPKVKFVGQNESSPEHDAPSGDTHLIEAADDEHEPTPYCWCWPSINVLPDKTLLFVHKVSKHGHA